MKKLIYLLAIAFIVSCNSNDEPVNTTPEVETTIQSSAREANLTWGYYKYYNSETKVMTNIIVPREEMEEMERNDKYVFKINFLKESTEQNIVAISARYMPGHYTGGVGIGPSDVNPDYPDDFCHNIAFGYSSSVSCSAILNNYLTQTQAQANTNCQRITTPKLCCRGTEYPQMTIEPHWGAVGCIVIEPYSWKPFSDNAIDVSVVLD